MEKTHSSSAEEQDPTRRHLDPPPGLTAEEFEDLKPSVLEHHTYSVTPTRQSSSLLAQRILAPPHAVWSVLAVGSTRDVHVISGLPAATSTERLDLLDDDRHVIGFTIVGGDHRLRNYRSVTSVHGFECDGKIWTVVLESYVVDVPEGNTEEDTRLFADTVVKLNLQKLASVSEGMCGDGDGDGDGKGNKS
ncbi:hypothetical protein JHK85_001160 [Glycine max]|nr:hypothetical protein JHK85_001160 [Glycine max]